MKIKIKFSFLFLCVAALFAVPATGQTRTIDSLRTIFYSRPGASQKLAVNFALLNEYESMPTDSIVYYYNKATLLLPQANSENNKLQLLISKMRLLRRENKREEAVELCDSIYKAAAAQNIPLFIYRRIISFRSGLLVSEQKYKEVVDLNLAVLKKAEEQKNDTSQLFCKITIGWAYMEVHKNRDALQWFLNAIEQINRIGYTEKSTTVYADLAAVYGELNMTDSAAFFINKAFENAYSSDNLTILANCWYIYSDIMLAQKNIPAAEQAMNKGVEIRKKIADPFYYVSDLYQLAVFYADNNEPQKGIAVSAAALEYAKQNNISGKYLILYEVLARNYKVAGDDKMYIATLEKIITLKDSVYSNNSAQSLADLQTKYEVQKKETLIAKQKLDLFQRKLLLYGSAAVVAILLLFILYRFRKYQQHQKIALATLMAEEKLQKKKAIRDAEEKERKRIASELHDNLGVQANAILHSSNLLEDMGGNKQTVVTDLQETAKEMMLNLRETLWALKAADVNAIEVWLRIVNFMKQMGRHYTGIHFTIEGNVPGEFIISSARALNIVLIVQETVNNAIRHSSAGTVSATTSVDGNAWKIGIKDDGIGFNVEGLKQETDRYGLKNMKERARACNFEYVLRSSPGAGTETVITVDIKDIIPA